MGHVFGGEVAVGLVAPLVNVYTYNRQVVVQTKIVKKSVSSSKKSSKSHYFIKLVYQGTVLGKKEFKYDILSRS